jgi:hypothetical protein
MIVYVATGVTGEFKEGRRKALCNWTMEALRDTGRKSWAQVFRFCSVGLQDIYHLSLFDAPLWYRPDLERPVKLFGV